MERRDAIKRTALMLGSTAAFPGLLGFLASCTSKPSLDWVPSFFTAEQAMLVSEIAEGILPKTDTPGAKELGVPKFIEGLVSECFTNKHRDVFFMGLDQFAIEAKERYGDDFVALSHEQKENFLKSQNERILDLRYQQDDVPTFFWMIKEATLLGYFTTEKGATEVLQYKLIPAYYEGCISLEEAGGKAWATS
jgi:hypothetical protein